MPMQSARLSPGPGSFPFVPPNRPGPPMTVWTWCPTEAPAKAPVLIVLHGASRNARTYRDAWVEAAEAAGALLVVPEFSKALFPTPREYEVGNMRDRQRLPLPPEEWVYATIEALFDAAVRHAGSRRRSYFLYGHSAGGQLVHRLLTFAPKARVEAAVSANAGCYTMPVAGERFPYGLDGWPVSDDDLRRLFARRHTILLGEEDTDEEDAILLRSPEAMRQGPHRLARGHCYFRTAEREAARLGAEFRWRLVTVPGVGHSNKRLAPHAARLLVGDLAR